MLSFSSVSTTCLRFWQHFRQDPRDTCVLPDIELLARDGGVDERRWCCWTIRGGVRLRLSLGFNRCFAVGENCWFGIFTLIPSYSDCETFCAYLDIYRRFLTCNVWFLSIHTLWTFVNFVALLENAEIGKNGGKTLITYLPKTFFLTYNVGLTDLQKSTLCIQWLLVCINSMQKRILPVF